MDEKKIAQAIDFAKLLYKKKAGTLSVDEFNLLEQWVKKGGIEAKLYEQLSEFYVLLPALLEQEDYDIESKIQQLFEASGIPVADKQPVALQKRKSAYWWWAAASIFMMLSVGTLYLISYLRTTGPYLADKKINNNDIQPYSKKATLTLSNGKIVTLDSVAAGLPAVHESAEISKTSTGQIVVKNSAAERQIIWGTLEVPKGGRPTEVKLPDGSIVWVNVGSSIVFPTAFAGKERNVTLSGEAYFEVAHNASKPFIVNSGKNKITVLGTHFNVTAYKEASLARITLLQGKINVNNALILAPNQQALITNNSIKLNVHPDIEKETAWRSNYFQFKESDLQEIMAELARWYDANVVYEGKIPEKKFSGKIPRSNTAAETLKILSLQHIHFKIENKKIIVMP